MRTSAIVLFVVAVVVALYCVAAAPAPALRKFQLKNGMQHNKAILSHNKNKNLHSGMKVDEEDSYVVALIRKHKGDELVELHGLWPDPEAKYSFCPGEAFNLTKLTPLIDEIDLYWHGWDRQYTLVKHEWEKHGTCYAQINNSTQIRFFEHALELLKEYTPHCNNDQKKECYCYLDKDFVLTKPCVQK